MMETRVWHKVEDKQGVVLALTGDSLYRFEFNGKNAKREATEATTALVGGQSPAAVVSAASQAIPLSAIRRVEVSHGLDTVKFVTVEGDKPVNVEFMVRSGDDAPGIARATVERTTITDPERREDVGVVEALLGPVILGVIVGVAWAFIYHGATTLDEGGDLKVDQGSRRGRGVKQLVAFIAGILGTKGTIIVGVLLLLAFVGWAVLRIVKRPQRLVWGPATS